MISMSDHDSVSSRSSRHRSPSPHDDAAPPLPPRTGTIHLTPSFRPSTPHVAEGRVYSPNEDPQHSWRSSDPRSSSTQSLLPTYPVDGSFKRTLLLIYVHGFLGDESSFQSFPAHVHNLLSITLAETHAVHTKIYPRYKSRRAIEFARDDFSKWLTPHESPTTDVVLLGHSMGGILSAEVVLLPPSSPDSALSFRHRFLGTINFDTPFLGMHPGVITSGLSSLFRPAPSPPRSPSPTAGVTDSYGRVSEDSQLGVHSSATSMTSLDLENVASHDVSGNASIIGRVYQAQDLSRPSTNQSFSTLTSSSTTDPNYNPPFPNDIRIPIRSKLNSALHFVVKHSDGLTRATRQYVTSHLEFGGCLADYPGLRRRYNRIRALEDEADPITNQEAIGSAGEVRVRFLNYYTASTGLPKGVRSPSTAIRGEVRAIDPISETYLKTIPPEEFRSPSRSPQLSVTDFSDDQIISSDLGGSAERDAKTVPNAADATENPDEGNNNTASDPVRDSRSSGLKVGDHEEVPKLQVETAKGSSAILIPPEPEKPTPFDSEALTDLEERRMAERDYARDWKAYKQAVQEREKAIKAKSKARAKEESHERKQRQKQLKIEEKEAKQRLKGVNKKLEKNLQAPQSSLQPQPPMSTEKVVGKAVAAEKKPRDRKFCLLPPKVNGKRDPTWVRVFMEGVDEVGAHCGLFFTSEAYEKLVGDVGATIEEWVREDLKRKGDSR